MLCRNFFCLKSNQYFWFSSSNSWYIFVCWISLFCINFAPHFTLLKFFGRRQFPEILKLPFSPVFTRVSHEFCMYFQTTYYRPVAGGSNGTPAALPRGQTGPPQPPSSHTAGLTEFLDSHQLWDCQTFPEMYLKISAASLADPEEMRYITPGHPASGKYHTGNNISAYT